MADVNGNDHINGDDHEFRYLNVVPEKAGLWELVEYAVEGHVAGRFIESSDDEEVVLGSVAAAQRWVIVVSIIVRKIIALFGNPMELTGYVVDFVLNFLSLNGNLLGLIFNIIHGAVMVPQRGTETFISTIGQLDGRINLYKSEEGLAEDTATSEATRIRAELGNLALMDLCIMASKLAYENARVIREIVTEHWKMHFVEFYDCWNDFQKQMSTEVFILCDKPKDANFVLISFRGTEPFDADDWSTDFDYSWYEIPQLGKLHMGFLEAIGLGNRTDAATFYNQIVVYNQLLQKNKGVEGIVRTFKGILAQSSDDVKIVPPDMVKKSAYYVVREKLKSLLEEHKNAKFIVTGHSLGGALAILFPCVLVLHEETDLMDRLLGIYTFGQPRIGNRQLGRYMEARLNNPVQRYFRVVYSNDLVPRLPYDNRTFLFKHFGVCLYYDSLFNEHVTEEEPNRNFLGLGFLIPSYLIAAWELLRSFIMGYTYGPEYKEGWFSVMLRFVGLVLPGISAHSPTNYVNSVRLGKRRTLLRSYH